MNDISRGVRADLVHLAFVFHRSSSFFLFSRRGKGKPDFRSIVIFVVLFGLLDWATAS